VAVRTVSVELKMKIADFLRGVGEASAATKILGKEFDDLGKKSEKFSTAKPSKEMQNFSRVINSSLRDGETGFQSIQRSIDDTKTHIVNLRKEFSTTGNASVFGDLKSAQKDLRTLENIFKEIAPSASQGGAQAGKSFMSAFSEATTLAESAGPVGLALGAAVAVVAVPVVVSALTAGVAGAIGLGVIAAGALIEKNDPVIAAAFAPLKKTITLTLADAAKPLQQSFEDAIRSVDLFVHREGPALKGLFTSVAPAVGIITSGVESLVSKLLPEFTAIGSEFSKALANPNVHAALAGAENDFANLFKTIGDNPQVIAVGFRTIAEAISFVSGFMSGLINITNTAITDFDKASRSLSKFLGGSGETGQKQLQDPFTLVHQAFPKLAAELSGAQGQFQSLGTTLSNVGAMAAGAEPLFGSLDSSIKQLGKIANDVAAGALQNLQNQMLSMREGQLGFNASVLQVISTLKDGKKSLSQHTAAGIADNQAIDQSIKLNLDQFDSNIKAGKGVNESTKAFNGNIDALETSLRKAGLLTAGVKTLIETYRKVPAKKATSFNAPGLAAAKKAVDGLLTDIHSIPRSKTFTLHVVTDGNLNQAIQLAHRTGQNIASRWGNFFDHNAFGGFYEKAAIGKLSQAQTYSAVNPGRFMIAEPQTGGEAFIPKNGDYGRSMSIISAAAGWYGASVVPGGGGSGGGPMTLIVKGGDATGAAFVQTMRFAIQQRGGDPVKVLTPA